MVVKFWDIRKEPFMKDKGVYIISTESLSKKGLYKVGFSGSSLAYRLGQIHQILSPPMQESLLVYGFVLPKTLKKSGMKQNVRSKELNQIEKIIHKYYKDRGLLSAYPDSHLYSEWIYEKKLSKLYTMIEKLLGDYTMDYHINFMFVEL